MDKRGKGRAMKEKGEKEEIDEKKKEGTAKVKIREEKFKKGGREDEAKKEEWRK